MTLLCLFLCGCSRADRLFEIAITNGDYNKAVEIYNDSLCGNTKAEKAALSFMNNFIDNNLSDYSAGKISADDFSTAFTTVERINRRLEVLDTMDDYNQKYQAVRNSKAEYEKGIIEFDKENWLISMNNFSLVVIADTENYEKAQKKIAEAQNNFEDASLKEASDLTGAGDYSNAIYTVRNAISHLGETHELAKMHQYVVESCESSAIQKAEGFLSEMNFSDARKQLESAADIIGLTERISSCLETIYTTQVETELKNAFNSKNYLDGLITVYRFDGLFVVTDAIDQYYCLCYDAYIDEMDSNADKAFGVEQDYDAAIKVLNECRDEFAIRGIDIEQIGNISNHIKEQIYYYLEYKPVLLTSLTPTQKGSYLSMGNDSDISQYLKDVNGNIYTQGSAFVPNYGFGSGKGKKDYHNDVSITYNLNYQYSYLTGIVFRPYTSLSFNGSAWQLVEGGVKICGDDGIVLFESSTIDLNSYDTFPVFIDVTGVRNLTIMLKGFYVENAETWGFYSYYPLVCMADVQLYKHPVSESVAAQYSSSSNQTPSKQSIKKGDTLFLGKYEQDDNDQNGKENIEWIVFATNNKYVYLLSKKVLEVLPFHNTNNAVNYENSEIRGWLNNTFTSVAFNEDEVSMLVTMTAEMPHNYDYPSTPQGSDVDEKISLMSVVEIEEYFPKDKDRLANGTTYAINRGLFQGESGFCPWWTRTMGKSSWDATIVKSDGSFNREGRSITEDWIGIRPCICLTWESCLDLAQD